MKARDQMIFPGWNAQLHEHSEQPSALPHPQPTAKVSLRSFVLYYFFSCFTFTAQNKMFIVLSFFVRDVAVTGDNEQRAAVFSPR